MMKGQPTALEHLEPRAAERPIQVLPLLEWNEASRDAIADRTVDIWLKPIRQRTGSRSL